MKLGLGLAAGDREAAFRSRSHLNSGRAASSICQGLATVLKVEEGALPTGSTGSGIE
jgi:hypothetical protein